MSELCKKCSCCGKAKELVFFHNKKQGKNGKSSICIDCCKQYREKNKTKASLYSKEYYIRNKEKLLIGTAKLYIENKEKFLLYAKNYVKENREYIRLRSKKNYQKNKEQILNSHKQYRAGDNYKAIIKEYRENNREKISLKAKTHKKESADKLEDPYIISLLTKERSIYAAYITSEIIELKRLHIQTVRIIKELTQ